MKRLIEIILVLAAIALVLNLKVAGRPAREIAGDIWKNPGVQKVYQGVRDRFMALIRKDISVEEVFNPELPKSPSSQSGTASGVDQAAGDPAKSDAETRVINLEKLDEADRKALEQILEKSSK